MRQLSCRKPAAVVLLKESCGIAHALYEIDGNSRAVSLHRMKPGNGLPAGGAMARIVESQALHEPKL